jgi:hypothetical protein
MFLNHPRPILRMKKLLLLTAVLFGTVAASQAGVHVGFGINLPFPPIPLPGRVIISQPAPVYVEPAPVCPPAPVYVEPYCAPRVYYPAPRYYSYPSYRGSWGHYDGHYYGHSSHGSHGHGGWDDHGHRR